MGAHDIGVMQVRTAEENGLLGEDFTILKGVRRFWSESQFGALYTRRSARASDTFGTTPTDPLHSIALELHTATRTFLGDKNLRATTTYVHTTNLADTGKSARIGFSVMYPNDLVSASFRANETQENYDPALGFVSRRGLKQQAGNLTIAPRPENHSLIRQYSFGVGGDRITDPANHLLSRSINLSLFRVNTHAGDNIEFRISREYERLDRDFRQPRGEIVLSEGSEYRFTRYRIGWGMSNQRIFALGGSYSWGNYFSGTRREFAPRLGIRPQVGLVVNLSGQFNRIDLAEGSFSTSLLQADINKQFRPWISLASNLQYDTLSRIIGWQARFRWIVKPGNDIYFVYTQNWQDKPGDIGEESRIETIDRKAASKIVFTHRF